MSGNGKCETVPGFKNILESMGGMLISALKKEIAKTEIEIETLESEIIALETQLGDPDVYSNVERLSEVNAIYESNQKQLEEKNKYWEKIVLELEELE